MSTISFTASTSPIRRNVELEITDGKVTGGTYTRDMSFANPLTMSNFTAWEKSTPIDLDQPEVREVAERMTEWYTRAGIDTVDTTDGNVFSYQAPGSDTSNYAALSAAQGKIELASKTLGNAAGLGAALLDALR